MQLFASQRRGSASVLVVVFGFLFGFAPVGAAQAGANDHINYGLTATQSVVYVDDGFTGSTPGDSKSFPFANPTGACAATTAHFGFDAFATIADGLSHVISGGTVCVAKGTYPASVTVATNPVQIIGDGNTASDTVITGSVTLSVSGASSAAPLLLQNLRVSSGSNGVNVGTASHLAFSGVAFAHNGGAGLNFNATSDDVVILNSLFDANIGIGLNTAATARVSNVSITGSTFSNNVAGLVLFGSGGTGDGQINNWTIDSSQFLSNANSNTTNFGGGIWIKTGGAGSAINNFSVTNSTLNDNGSSNTLNQVGITVRARPGTTMTGISICKNAFSETATPGTQLTGINIIDETGNTGYKPMTVCSDNTFTNLGHSVSGLEQFTLYGSRPVVNITGGNIVDTEYLNGTVTRLRDSALFPTITLAINDAGTTTGDTLLAGSGVYNENVIVNKSITLYGPFHNTAGSDSSRTGTGEAVISPGSGYAVQVTANNVTFNGFTIKGVDNIAFLSGHNADGHVLNNRFVDSTGTGLYIEYGSVASTGWLIQDNLFADLGSTSTDATAIILPNTDGAHVRNNVIRNVSYQGIQLSGATNIEIRGNDISAVQRDGINIAGSSNVIIADNTITDINQADLADRGAIRLYDSATGIEAACNTIDAQRGGIALKAGTAGGLRLFDNKVIGNSVAGTRFIASYWSGGIDIGSNWYDGTPVVTGADASSVRLADALSANPITNSACGNNTPTRIVAYSGTPQSTAIGTAFSQPLVARVEDALGGAVMASQTVTFSAPASSGPSATLGTTSGNTDYNGTLSTSATANGLVGGYNVSAASGSFSTSNFALTNGKGTGTVAWDTTTFVYTGSNVTPTAHIAEETGATCSFNPTSVGPNVNTYSVTATCESANYTATGTTNVSISPATATLALGYLVQAYDGAPKSVLVTTTPAGVGYSVSYVGTGSTSYGPSTQAPTAVGTYTATASVDDANHTGSNVIGTLQIVQGNGDIALVVNGPTGPAHVGDFAQFAATMLANPALHQGEKFAYEVVLSKSNGTPLAVSDVTSMEVFYNGAWVDVTTLTGGTLPFMPDGSGNLVYTFPDGIPGYTDGFPITDASWTWNVRFTFATTGTYTGTWTLEDGGPAHAIISPLVTGSAAVVVQDALPPTDIHLVLGGPAENVQANTPVEYTGTMLADPSLHAGEKYFVRVTVAKSGGSHVLTASDLSAVEIYYHGTWQSLPTGSFVLDGSGNLVYDFPQPADPSGFEIEDPEWTWNFRVTYADTGTYTATAEVIHADEASLPSPQVFASDATSTTVVPQVVVPPTMNLVLVGPVGDVAVGAPTEYTGTLLANPVDFTGRTFWVRVRLSKNGGAAQMTAADLDKMELYNGGGWMDATSAIKSVLVQDNNNLVYYFPQPNAAFSIDSPQWTWHFRFTYADVGLYSVQADVIDSTDMPLLNATSLADATLSTNVVPHADITAQVLIDPTSLHVVYDTNSHAAVVTTDPAMLAVNVSYNGSATLPTDAGVYNVVATITEPGYVGSANAVLVIDKAPSTVTIDSADLTQVFGATVPVDASASPISTGGQVDVTYNGSAAVPTNIGIYTVVATLVDPNYTGSASATLNIIAPSLPNLAIQITDGRDYVQYGKLLTYRITVSNIGNVAVNGASVSVPLPATVLGAQPGWSCVPVGMATCGSGGNGALSDTANIPVGGGVVYLLNVWANDDHTLTTDEILMQASVTFTGDVDPSDNMATDLTTMVIFRDGFEEGGDGAQAGILTTNAIGTAGIDATQMQLLDLTGAWSSNGDVVRVAHLVTGRTDMLDVQAIHIGNRLLVRLAGVANGRHMVGAWSTVPAGTATLAVGLASVGMHSMLILAGASQDLTVQLSDNAISMSVIGTHPIKP